MIVRESRLHKAEMTTATQIPNKHRTIKDSHYKAITSFSYVIGNVTAIVIEYILSAFPKNYFKVIWNSMEVPYAQRSKAIKDIFLKPKPIMLVNPIFDPSDDAEVYPSSEFDARVYNEPNADIWLSEMHSQLISRASHFQLYCKPRRYKMKFNVSFVFDSEMQRIQAQEFIRQSIRHRHAIVTHRFIENNIPDDIMKAIADIYKIDYRAEDFLKWVNIDSRNPITRRLRTGSGNIEFFTMEKSPFEIKFTDLPITNGEVRKGNITVSSSFSENISVEFVANAMYYLRTNVDIDKPIIENNNDIKFPEPSDTINVVSSEPLLVKEFPRFMDRDELFVKIKQVTVQPDKNGDNVINIFNLLANPELANVLNYYRDNNLDVDFLKVAVRKECDSLDGYTFDSKTLKLYIPDMDMYKLYYIAIYLNKSLLNEVKQNIFQVEQYDKLEDNYYG